MPIHWQHDFTCFCTLRHYVIVNLNFHENHVQYVLSKADDPSWVTQYTVRELSYRKHKNWKKKIFENQWWDVGLEWRLMTFKQRERAIGILTADMSTRDIARHFQRHESTISRLLNRFQQTGNVADRPRLGRPRKTTLREDRFLTTSSRRNRFLSSRNLGRLLRNTTGTRVCDRTVRNRLHAARLKACRSYVGIPLTWRNYRTCCGTVFATT